MSKFLTTMVFLSLLWACDQQGANQEAATSAEETEVGEIASIIRNPITADSDQIDTSELAKMEFDTTAHNFGTVKTGDVINHEFFFTNEGSVPLIISDVRSTCGCTVADWPREPIAPGDGGSIPVRFDTKNKSGFQSKPVTITANTLPAKTNLFLNGKVEE